MPNCSWRTPMMPVLHHCPPLLRLSPSVTAPVPSASGASPGLKALQLLLKGSKSAPKSPSGADIVGTCLSDAAKFSVRGVCCARGLLCEGGAVPGVCCVRGLLCEGGAVRGGRPSLAALSAALEVRNDAPPPSRSIDPLCDRRGRVFPDHHARTAPGDICGEGSPPLLREHRQALVPPRSRIGGTTESLPSLPLPLQPFHRTPPHHVPSKPTPSPPTPSTPTPSHPTPSRHRIIQVRQVALAGITISSGVGNSGPSWGSVLNPADEGSVLGVGGLAEDGSLASWSSRGMSQHEMPYGAGR